MDKKYGDVLVSQKSLSIRRRHSEVWHSAVIEYLRDAMAIREVIEGCEGEEGRDGRRENFLRFIPELC